MYKILVISDTHGKLGPTIDLINRFNDLNHIFHLGDMVNDAEDLKAIFDIEVDYVAGNCDFYSDVPHNKVVEILGKRFYLTHGHLEKVKYTYEYLEKQAEENNFDGVFFGHTHMQHFLKTNGKILCNPGSISQPRDGKNPGFALIQIDDKACIHGALGNL